MLSLKNEYNLLYLGRLSLVENYIKKIGMTNIYGIGLQITNYK